MVIISLASSFFTLNFILKNSVHFNANNGYGSALQRLENNVDARLNLASLLIEDSKEDEAISLLSPPKNFGMYSQDFSPPLICTCRAMRDSLFVKFFFFGM